MSKKDKKKKKKAKQFLPKRSAQHITGEQAVAAFRSALPPAWISREVSPDYGIDCHIEIVDSDNSVTGAMVYAQLKGTESVNAKQQLIVQVKTSSVRYWMSLPVPVVLVRVLGDPPEVYWIDVRDNLQDRRMLDDLFRNQNESISFNFKDAKLLKGTIDELEQLAIDHQLAVCYMRDKNDAENCGDFVGYHIFIHVFNGDISEMKTFLRTKASDDQLAKDYPFAVWLEEQLNEDPTLLDRIRTLVASTNLDGTEVESSEEE